jgi:SAM-dependent methyltransferase
MKYSCLADVVRDLEEEPVETGGNIYHPIPFPEFSHLKTSSNAAEFEKKWRLISRGIERFAPDGISGLRVLDVGANAGFYTYSLAQAGALVTSFEPHPRYSEIGPIIIEEKGLSVTWHGIPYDATLVGQERFDVALLLSVFQWMSNGDERVNEAAEQLLSISRLSRYMFFELGYNYGKSCISTTRWNHYAELVEFLREHTEYTFFALLGTTRLWRRCKRYLILCSRDGRFEDKLSRRLWRSLRI